jgi:hypothetical protein
MEMFVSTINIINQRLERIFHQKLSYASWYEFAFSSDPLLFGFFLFQYFGRNFQVKSSWLPTYPYPHDNVRSNISMEMFVSTINIINQRLKRIDVVVCEKLSKLDKKNYERW